jgi:hypothetical protein
VTIRVHIDRLVLDGLPVTGGQGPLVQRAVEAELARLFAAGGLGPGLAAGGTVDRLAGGSVAVGRNDRPADLGRAIARAVYGSVRPG